MSPTHKVSLTAPMASVKVRWVLRYQAAAWGVLDVDNSSQAHKVIRL